MNSDKKIELILELLRKEAEKASNQHKPYNSSHEGYAVLLEEVDELWEKIKAKEGVHYLEMKEVVQIGAVVIRYLMMFTSLATLKKILMDYDQ